MEYQNNELKAQTGIVLEPLHNSDNTLNSLYGVRTRSEPALINMENTCPIMKSLEGCAIIFTYTATAEVFEKWNKVKHFCQTMEGGTDNDCGKTGTSGIWVD